MRGESLDAALEEFGRGETVVVMVQSGDGSARSAVERLPESLAIHGRVACSESFQCVKGLVANFLDLESFNGGAVVLEDAQWADPSSLAQLQRVLRQEDAPSLAIVAHRPVEGIDLWWLESLEADLAGSNFHRITSTEAEPEPTVEPPDDGQSLDLIAATQLMTGPVTLNMAQAVVSLSPEETMALGASLTEAGWLQETRAGYLSGPAALGLAIGEVRVGRVASVLASELRQAGESSAAVGRLLVDAARFEEAFPVLRDASRTAADGDASGEAFLLARKAIEVAEQAEVGLPADLAELHLTCARFLRLAGWTGQATDHVEAAARHLSGKERIDALRLRAILEDDAQRPQDAERSVAMAELEASGVDDPSLLGPLLTLHARSLNRIGFADEADAALQKALRLLEDRHSEPAWLEAISNQAWLHFDRGQAVMAESEFARLVEDARKREDMAAVSNHEAWQARALFAAGRPDEALKAVSDVEDISVAERVDAPVFLTQLAMAEGGILYANYGEALTATAGALDIVDRALPAWENMVRSLRAAAHMHAGDLEAAKAELDIALEKTPLGANGWRWRSRCEAIQLELEAADAGRDFVERAEDLADRFLQARLYGWAAELLCVIAERGGRKEAASEALAVATQIGQPMLAARAAQAGDLWSEPIAASTIVHLRHLDAVMPADWKEGWRALPHVESALAAAEPVDPVDSQLAAAEMERALERSGLTGDIVLSPAQRRHRSLVARPSRRRSLVAVMAAVLGVIALAAGTAFLVARTGATEETQPPVVAPTTTPLPEEEPEPLAPEETQIEIENARGFLFGTATNRGGSSRNGYVDVEGPRAANGYYWKTQTAGPIDASPLAFGQQLFLGSSEGTFYILDQSTGEFRTLPAEGRISAAAALGEADIGEDRTPSIVVVVDDAGVVRAIPAGIQGFQPWTVPLGERIRSAPIVSGERVYVATTEGYVHVIDAVGGDQLGRWPVEGDPMGPINADLAMSDGLLYVGSQDGLMRILDTTGEQLELVCEFDARASIDVNPIIDQGVVYIATSTANMWMLPKGQCDGQAPNRLSPYVAETPIDVPPAIVNGVLYLPDGPYLYARDLANSNADIWPPGHVDANAKISAPPVVTKNAVYFAAEDGVVYAVDANSGDLLWTWETGLTVRGGVAVVEDAVYIASGDGVVYAVGE